MTYSLDTYWQPCGDCDAYSFDNQDEAEKAFDRYKRTKGCISADLQVKDDSGNWSLLLTWDSGKGTISSDGPDVDIQFDGVER